MKMKAKDSFYLDETKMVHSGQNFEISSDETAKDLIKQGLAEPLGEKSMKNAPKNKAQSTPATKAE